MIIDYDKYSMIINNERTVINSAAFHYFRCPGIATWRDRLSKIKACGYNAVDLYLCWKYHSSKHGIYDFTGIRDLRALLDITAELGLFVIVRPGPFINAELSLGGLPEWLLNIPDIIIRNKKNGDFIYSEPYMKALKEWYSRVIPIINEYHNVIAFQIENEYCTNEAEPDYLQELYDLSRSLGIKAPIFHNDALCVGLYSDIANIYAFDCYPTINLYYDWKNFPDTFGILDNAENNIKDCCEGAPVYIAELQAGWFDKWGGIGYENISKIFKDQHINIVTKTVLSQGITMFNHYMGCGGTSWGNLACSEVYTSYDFAAPISETGLLKDSYYKAKQINYFLRSFNLASTDLIIEGEGITGQSEENIFARLRQDNINGCKWLFVRNLNKKEKDLFVINKYNLAIKPFDMKILPVGLNLYACTIEFSTMEIFARVNEDNYEKIYMLLEENTEVIISSTENTENIIVQSSDTKDLASYKFEKNGKTTEIIFIMPETAAKTWLVNDKIIMGAEFLTDNCTKAAHKKETTDNDIPILDDWKIYKCAPEIDPEFDFSNWSLLTDNGKFDCISNKIYDDYIWYNGSVKTLPDFIEINAKHCWAVYLNGKQIYSHDTFGVEQEISETITFEIDKNLASRTGENRLTVLVQNLGFDKGFQGDLDAPRGIISCKTILEKTIEWRIRGGLTPVMEEWDFIEENNIENASKNTCLQWASTEFSLLKNPAAFNPFLLDLSQAEFNKADIYLNGNKIGVFWKSKGPQTMFYLPEEFLLSKNKLSLIIWDRENTNKNNNSFNSERMCVNIIIRNIQNYELISVEK